MLRRVLAFDWTPGAKYTLTIDSAAVTGIYGDHNKPFKHFRFLGVEGEFVDVPVLCDVPVLFEFEGLREVVSRSAKQPRSGKSEC